LRHFRKTLTIPTALALALAAGVATTGFASAATPSTVETFNAAGTSMTVTYAPTTATTMTVIGSTQGAFPDHQGTNNIVVPIPAGSTSFTIPVNPDQTYITTGAIYSAYATSPGSPLAGSIIESVDMVGQPNPTVQNFTVTVDTPNTGNTLRGLQWSVDGGPWGDGYNNPGGVWPVTASTVNGQGDKLVNGVWTIPVNAISGTNVIGGIGVQPGGFGTVWATGSTHTIAVRAYDNAYGTDSNVETSSFTVALPDGTTPTIGIGTANKSLCAAPYNCAAPYFGAGAYSTTDPAAPGIGVYPAVPIAPGTSLIADMWVQNTGTASEVATISGSGYTLQPAFADGATLASGTNANATTTNDHAMPARWVSAPATQTLTWDQEVAMPITITVPDGTPAGNYYGVVFATVTGDEGTGITSQVQSGVRAYITVSG
jgi:hypothetical protein